MTWAHTHLTRCCKRCHLRFAEAPSCPQCGRGDASVEAASVPRGGWRRRSVAVLVVGAYAAALLAAVAVASDDAWAPVVALLPLSLALVQLGRPLVSTSSTERRWRWIRAHYAFAERHHRRLAPLFAVLLVAVAYATVAVSAGGLVVPSPAEAWEAACVLLLLPPLSLAATLLLHLALRFVSLSWVVAGVLFVVGLLQVASTGAYPWLAPVELLAVAALFLLADTLSAGVARLVRPPLSVAVPQAQDAREAVSGELDSESALLAPNGVPCVAWAVVGQSDRTAVADVHCLRHAELHVDGERLPVELEAAWWEVDAVPGEPIEAEKLGPSFLAERGIEPAAELELRVVPRAARVAVSARRRPRAVPRGFRGGTVDVLFGSSDQPARVRVLALPRATV